MVDGVTMAESEVVREWPDSEVCGCQVLAMVALVVKGSLDC